MDNIKETVLEVTFSILPITVVILILQFTLIWLPLETLIQFLIGVLMVGIGLMLFLLGVNAGLLPVGEMIGSALSKTKKLGVIILFGVILGIVVTVAEPDVRVLSTQVDQVSNGRSEEHTSELQSRGHLVCRLLLEKKKKQQQKITTTQHSKDQLS